MASPKVFTIQRGLSTAQLLHALHDDNRVIILDRADKAQCKAPQSFVDSERVTFIQCDVTSWDSLRSAFALGIERFGELDNVYVNAGINEYGNQLFQDDLDQNGKLKKPDSRVLSIDLDAAISTIKLAIHHMRHRRDGRRGGNIVMTASLAGYLGSAGAPLYSAAKHGLIGLLRALKNDTAKLGIAISLVAPGITLTDLVAGRGEENHCRNGRCVCVKQEFPSTTRLKSLLLWSG
ncbi:hypothetical protein AMS68_005096 [Peltaster fructicola]|uniref:Uncharacterized protein n=1 Tax=Peltaster fructicola TaxID=286661 RepID=A0A6H0XY83_9PEZI|nr:hypothetical protein AMS68_005096 [Peltaster fructicola]